MYEYPTVKLELQNMRQTIVHAFGDYQDTMAAEVDRQLSNIVKNFDYEAVVSEIANEVLREAVTNAVRSYFKFGEGHDLILALITEMLNKPKVSE